MVGSWAKPMPPLAVRYDHHVRLYEAYRLALALCGRPMIGDWCAA